MHGGRLKYQFANSSLLSGRHFEYVDVFKEIIIRKSFVEQYIGSFKGEMVNYMSVRRALRAVFCAPHEYLTNNERM